MKAGVALIALVLTTAAISLCASPIPNIPYEDLYARSDLVVIGRPVISRDTSERTKMGGVSVVGVTTEFRALFVFKGAKRQRFKLHHFREWPKTTLRIGNPIGITFDPPKNKRYLMFLVREPDGRFAPALGQEDVEDVSAQEVIGSSADY